MTTVRGNTAAPARAEIVAGTGFAADALLDDGSAGVEIDTKKALTTLFAESMAELYPGGMHINRAYNSGHIPILTPEGEALLGRIHSAIEYSPVHNGSKFAKLGEHLDEKKVWFGSPSSVIKMSAPPNVISGYSRRIRSEAGLAIVHSSLATNLGHPYVETRSRDIPKAITDLGNAGLLDVDIQDRIAEIRDENPDCNPIQLSEGLLEAASAIIHTYRTPERTMTMGGAVVHLS